MALRHSPSTVSNGLVFAYDMYNSRSYKGPTLQNKLSGLSATAGSGTGYVLTASSEIANIPTVGELPVTICNLQNTGASWCCINFMNFGNTGSNMSGSTLYTYMILYRVDSGYTHPNFMYRYEYNSAGTYLTESGIHDTNKRTYLGNGWYYAWNTFTTQSTTTNMTCYGFSYNYSNFTDRYSYAKVAIVQGDYSGMHPSLWPDLGQTISNTQSILDLTGRKTLTIQNLSYASIGTFSFDGVDDSIDSTTSAGLTGTGSWTMESVFKINGIPSNALYGNVIVDTDATGGSANMILVDYGGGHGGSQNQLLYASRPSTGGSYTLLGGPILTQGTYYHVAVVRNDVTNTKLYVNGSLYSTYSGNVPTATQPLVRIGRWTDGTVYGNSTIPNVKIYNRALSDQEVAQNYQALRGRYGI
jgi:hypothetical protein